MEFKVKCVLEFRPTVNYGFDTEVIQSEKTLEASTPRAAIEQTLEEVCMESNILKIVSVYAEIIEDES